MRIVPLLSFCTLISCGPEAPKPTTPLPAKLSVQDDLRAVYDSLGLHGSFILHDRRLDQWTYVDSTEASVATLPASTYKVLSSMIALEENVVADEHALMKWDGVKRRPEVDRDLDLADAMRHSAYWFHRDVARALGADRLKAWWDTVGYGNADTSGGFDRAWVAGNLRITPREQVLFLERLSTNDLPFSPRSMDIVRRIMIQEDTLGYVLRGKTGWAQSDSSDLGWFVGWVERADGRGPYFFANRVRCSDTANTRFGPGRKATALTLLRYLEVLP